MVFFFFSSRRRHTRWNCDWSSDVCSSDLRARRDWAGWNRDGGGHRCVSSSAPIFLSYAAKIRAGENRSSFHGATPGRGIHRARPRSIGADCIHCFEYGSGGGMRIALSISNMVVRLAPGEAFGGNSANPGRNRFARSGTRCSAAAIWSACGSLGRCRNRLGGRGGWRRTYCGHCLIPDDSIEFPAELRACRALEDPRNDSACFGDYEFLIRVRQFHVRERVARRKSRNDETFGPYEPTRPASTGSPRISACSMLMPASSSSARLYPSAGVKRRPERSSGRGGRWVCQRFLTISKKSSQSLRFHMKFLPNAPGSEIWMRHLCLRSLAIFNRPEY